MGRYVAKRLAFAVLTLFLLSVGVFWGINALSGNPARRILGNFADEKSVKQLAHELGTDKPILTQYTRWITHALRGNLGSSYALRRPVRPLVTHALFLSLKLALVAFVIVVPLSILAGVIAGRRRGTIIDRTITTVGLAGIAIPEFVSGFLLIYLFAIKSHGLPSSALAPEKASVVTQLKHLILPAITLVIVLFGYIARMARAGTIDATEADYTRTAVLKGLPSRTVLRRHILPNALLPTITVIATQVGYLVGGLVAVELAFNYPGMGRLIRDAVVQKDFPLLQSAVLVVGIIYLIATLLADLLVIALNPRVRAATLS
jgi:peptide/nickel transport system permease protein